MQQRKWKLPILSLVFTIKLSVCFLFTEINASLPLSFSLLAYRSTCPPIPFVRVQRLDKQVKESGNTSAPHLRSIVLFFPTRLAS
ncbi:hypothetical protein E2C01_035241 [Portunus trituberculatus]|uniref:Uncharacterized protein n=1 Tax=Portunus trituberculatus TaxID=210409 RepID=A0A5B7F3Q1_PORTR|nr:hypothetical protein [Portunus trituberculatus]